MDHTKLYQNYEAKVQEWESESKTAKEQRTKLNNMLANADVKAYKEKKNQDSQGTVGDGDAKVVAPTLTPAEKIEEDKLEKELAK